jgi:7-cyano-7-deazaguanine synthase
MTEKAVVLLSGGLDSTTTLAIAKNEGYEIYAISFDYGQRHKNELAAAKRVALSLGVRQHIVISFDLRCIGGSALTSDMEVPKERELSDIGEGVPVTYVPARNTIFLSFSLGWAEVLGAPHIFIGVNALDYSGYPDCRPEYIKAYQEMANLATKAGVEGSSSFTIHTPLMAMSKADIVKKGRALGVDFSLTWTCYDPAPGGVACGRCDACILRLKGFDEAGSEDPVPYARGVRKRTSSDR